MADMIISGFVGKAIDVAVDEILRHIHIALRCKRELRSLEDLIGKIQPITRDIQRYRIALKFGQLQTPENAVSAEPSAVNTWLEELNTHLENATDMVEQCTIPSCNMVARYQLSKRIGRVIADIEDHLERTAMITIAIQFGQAVRLKHIGEVMAAIQERVDAVASSSSTTGASVASTSSSHPPQRRPSFHKPRHIAGQDDIFGQLQRLLTDAEEKSQSRIGVVGMGGVGKTLLLRRLEEYCKDVSDHFEKNLVLWLTISQDPSIPTLRKQLKDQLCGENEELKEQSCGEILGEKRFVLFLDDVWEGSGDSGDSLLERLEVPETSSSKIIVSSRNKSVLLALGVKPQHTFPVERLDKDDSWKLFCSRAFPYGNGIPPASLEEIAERVCAECGGLPLAIKVIGAAMAGTTEHSEWELMLQGLRNAGRVDAEIQGKLYDRLKLSYEALGQYDLSHSHQGRSLRLCFISLGAFMEDQTIAVEDVIKLWIGEGLLGTGSGDTYHLLAIGQTHVNLLSDRCLIEVTGHDDEGKVASFSMHDVLHDLALQIAENEENCFFKAGKPLNEFPADGSSIRNSVRISLMHTQLQSIPDTFKGTAVRALLLCGNANLQYLPATMIKSLISVRVLDLSGCRPLLSLPESLGCMKRLVYLNLSKRRIERLPASVRRLKRLQILELSGCERLRELPVGLDKLSSLWYLNVSWCKKLEIIPSKLSMVTSLRFLSTVQARPMNLWSKRVNWWVEREREESGCMSHLGRWAGERTEASELKDALHSLTNLTHLEFSCLVKNAIREGTLGSMRNMRTLVMHAYNIEALPDDMRSMSQLRSLTLLCNALVTIPPWLCDFQQLDSLSLRFCENLEGLPALQKLGRLRHLSLRDCRKLKELPGEFGKDGAFPALERFILVRMKTLESLPALEEGAMPLLRVLEIHWCPNMEELPEGVFNLKNLKKLQVGECPGLAEKAKEGGEYWKRARGKFSIEV